jgi:hypothetical protein
MTEEEWLKCGDPPRMLEFLYRHVSDRKMRLFAVACCRRVWELMPNDDCKQGIVAAELAADGRYDMSLLDRLSNSIYSSTGSVDPSAADEFAAIAARCVSSRDDLTMTARATAAAVAVPTSGEGAERKNEERCQGLLLRDIFGNPFRPATVDPAWLTSTVVALAEGIYADRAFDRMPILADALQDAGCDCDDILTHCRDTTLTHVRGCWVIDLLTSRA